MNIRELFKSKVAKHELCEFHYLEKTMNQIFEVPPKDRKKLRENMEYFLRTKDIRKMQVQFNAIAGFINDSQMRKRAKIEEYVYD